MVTRTPNQKEKTMKEIITNKTFNYRCSALKSLILLLVFYAIGPQNLAWADVVTDWNQTTLNTQAAVPFRIRTPAATWAVAMVHAASYDSINAIHRTPSVYA